ncbi:MAG: BamA/TamA family outer membrane protein [Myxococcota bacterium]
MDADAVQGDGEGEREETERRPGEVRGGRVRERPHPARGLLWVPRLLLGIPRVAFMVATEPLGLLLRLEDRYQLRAHFVDIFFNDERTFGVFPTLFVETGFGLNAGLHVVHTDLFGRGETLHVRAGFGGVYRQRYEMRFDTGSRLGRAWRMRFDAGYTVRSHRFFGLGNPDQASQRSVALPLDPSAGVGVWSEFFIRKASGRVSTIHEVNDHLRLVATYQMRRREVIEGDRGESLLWLSDAYRKENLPGSGVVVDVLPKLCLEYDRAERQGGAPPPPMPAPLPSSGWLARACAGYEVALHGPYRFTPVEVDVQPFIHLFGGDRVLRMRFRLAAAIGDRERIPFIDLPTLGGPTWLRGYTRERFRGPVSVLSTAEYRFPIGYNVSGYLFVDAGRTYDHDEAITLTGLRVGYGGGLMVFSSAAYLFTLQLATSMDGGFFVHFRTDTTDAF